jgi:pimeloyl-ACP methyl ester carboxylesterase
MDDLTGEDDPMCPLPVVEDLASQFPADTARLVRVPDARHDIFRDRPDLAFAAGAAAAATLSATTHHKHG